MSFDSYVFVLVFLPLLVFLWRAAAIVHRESLSLVLLAFSLLFGLLASPAGLLLLLCLLLVNYGFGLALAAPGERENTIRRKGLLILALLVNFTPLILTRLAALFGLPDLALPYQDLFTSGMSVPAPENAFVLQTAQLAGLSFWSLIQAAWLVSIFQRHTEPEGLLRHALFSLAFPWLLAGPIVRYEQMGPQFDNLAAPPMSVLVCGLGLFLAGLCKKVLLADWLGVHADTIFAAQQAGFSVTSMEAWLGLLAFSFQIYFDFSGYTDMALGIGLMLGLRLPENFRQPYRATGFIEFWRRWHITFSSWLRDSLYQPLAGSWPGFARIVLGILACMAFAGLWHGSGLTFLVWAGLHSLFLALNVAIRSLRSTGAGALLATVPMRVLSTCMTFVLVTLLWVLFRSDTLGHALAMYATLFNLQAPGALSFLVNGYFTGLLSLLPLLLGLVLVFALPTAHDIFLGCRDGSRPWLSFAPTLPWALVLALAAVACLMVMDRTRPFLF